MSPISMLVGRVMVFQVENCKLLHGKGLWISDFSDCPLVAILLGRSLGSREPNFHRLQTPTCWLFTQPR